MKTLRIALVCSLALLPLTAFAQNACPCVPVTHVWIVEACETWNCAVSAAILANGDKNVLTLPTGSDDLKWIVVRRVPAGSAYVPPDAPFQLETFDGASAATARFSALDQQAQPMMLTAPDGKFLVIMRAPGSRAHAAKH